MEDSNRYVFNSTDLLYKVYSYRVPLAIITGVAAVAAIIISFAITEKYKATVTLFPAPATSISKTFISSRSYSNNNSVFGEDEEVEQLLQVLHSEEIKQRVVEKYDLVKHYDIDKNDKYVQTKLSDAYKSNISFRRTTYMAIEISVLDISPDTAALIANDISQLLDSSMNRMQKERALQAFYIVEKEYLEKQAELEMLKDSMGILMQKGVFDFESQSEVYNNAYASALASGNTSGARKIKEQLDSIAKYGSSYIAVRNLLEFEQEQFTLLMQKYKEAKVDAESELPHTYIIDKAYTPDKKAYPKRSIIVLVTTISAFVVGFILLILFELYKDFRLKDIKQKD